MPRRDKHLYLDTDDKMVGGVCAGLARYFDIDTTLMRVIFVALAVVGGGSAIAYLILWVVLEPAPAGYWNDELPPPAQQPVAAAEDTGVIDLDAPVVESVEPAPAATSEPDEATAQDPTQT